jgi:hypothetical protein
VIKYHRVHFFDTLFVALLCALVVGCPATERQPSGTGADEPIAKQRPSVALQVLVVNDPELAESIRRLRGEWAERSGGELDVSSITWSELAGQPAVAADLIVFPSRFMGELCTRDWLRAVRSNVLKREALQASDFFPSIRNELIQWRGEIMALPLGIAANGGKGATGASASISLISMAVPHADSKEKLGILFDPETMRPQLTEPSFIQALIRLAESRNGTSVGRKNDLDAVMILGYADPLVAVTSSSRNAASAFTLLEWLALPETSLQLARTGNGVFPARRSPVGSPNSDVDNLSVGEWSELGKRLERQLGGTAYFVLPRLPGIDEYLGALDDAVQAAISESLTPEAALKQASERWEEITHAHGREKQRSAYLSHLGVAGE